MPLSENGNEILEIEKGKAEIFQHMENPLIRQPFTEDFAKRFSWSTNAIEGNTLSLEETIAVIDYDEVRSNHTYSEYTDAKNAYYAIQKMLLPFAKTTIDEAWIKKAKGADQRGRVSSDRYNVPGEIPSSFRHIILRNPLTLRAFRVMYRSGKEGDFMPNLRKIEAAVPAIREKKKVAAYARVSMQSERMLHSLSAQVSYYSGLIQKNPDWEYAGVYADDFISGTNTVKRDEFKRMLADCEDGKIDIILTKSISRFARNTVDLLETVRHLKDLGIEVRFEKENIRSMDRDGELMLTILASFAQEESRSISDNVKWGIRKRMQNGIPNGRFRIYGYRWEGDELVIVPEEAKIVKRIFQNFLDGKSRLETEREFAAEGITTRDGHRWTDSNLKVVLTNVTYTGNLLLQKEFVADPITKQKKKNRGELPQYYVEDTHPAIIDKATFDFVQEEMARRRELGALANKSLNTSCFTGKIKCPYCGQSYMHNKRVKNGNIQEYWNCGSKKKKKVGDGCPVGGTINHKNMVKVCTEVLGLTEFDESVFLEQVDHIDVPERYTLEFHMADGRVVTKGCPNTGHQDCWTPERRAAKAEFMKKEMARRKELSMHGAKKSHGDSGDH